MLDTPLNAGGLLLLHGVTGGWDELILLAAGVLLAVFVVKRTNRSAATEASDEDAQSPIDATREKLREQS
ncbi:MAG: hypothetical protein ACKVVP_11235 [Chloroflexota bacterium]